MTGTEKLRKENQALRKEIQDLKNQLKKITDVQKNTPQITFRYSEFRRSLY